MASGSFASFHLGRFAMTVGCAYSQAFTTCNDDCTPLLCIKGKLTCVLKCIFDFAASNAGVETVSRITDTNSCGYTVTSFCACGGMCCETVLSLPLHRGTNEASIVKSVDFRGPFLFMYLLFAGILIRLQNR